MILTFIITVIAFSGALGVKNGLIHKDKHRYVTAWKIAQSAAVISFASAILIQAHWLCLPLAFSIHWIVFELTLNPVAGWPLFWVGTSGKIDKSVRWIGNKISLHPEWTGILLKILALSISIFLLNFIPV